VLDLCTGTGALAVVAARAGAASITVVDVNRRALAAAWVNVALQGRRVIAHRGDLVDPVSDQRFDLIVSNPPYLPAENEHLPTRGPARAWDAGIDGRALLDRICAEAPKVIAAPLWARDRAFPSRRDLGLDAVELAERDVRGTLALVMRGTDIARAPSLV